MMTQQQLVGIYIASQFGGLMSGHNSISVKAGRGIEGDRYFSDSGSNRSSYKGQPDFEITLIESEVVSRFNEDMGYGFHESDFRRNLITKGVSLNSLEGCNFSINGIQMYGVRLCEPCASLQRRLGVSILPELMGKGGLRAQIKSNGIIRVGDRLDFS
jgi:MOSC domain-containing protein YiiM